MSDIFSYCHYHNCHLLYYWQSVASSVTIYNWQLYALCELFNWEYTADVQYKKRAQRLVWKNRLTCLTLYIIVMYSCHQSCLPFIFGIVGSGSVPLKYGQKEVMLSYAFQNCICAWDPSNPWKTLLALILKWRHLRCIIYSLMRPPAHIQSSLTLRSAKSKCHFRLPSPGHQEVFSDLLCQSVDACQPLFRSLPRFDGWTLRRFVLHSEHTHIVFVPETFALPDRRPREHGYDPHGNVTHGEIRPDRTMMWDNVTWNALPSLCYLFSSEKSFQMSVLKDNVYTIRIKQSWNSRLCWHT